MHGPSGTNKIITRVNNNPASTQPIPSALVSMGLLCAFGLWSSPALLLTYWGLIQELPSTKILFVYMALTGLYAISLRLLLGFLLKPSDEPSLLLVLLFALLAVCGLLLLTVGFNAVNALPWLALVAGIGGGGFVLLAAPAAAPTGELQYDLEGATASGHLGIIIGLLCLPLLVTFDFTGHTGQQLLFDASHFLGRVPVGTPIWLSWIGVFWALVCLLVLAIWLCNYRWHRNINWRGVVKVTGLYALALALSVVAATALLAIVRGSECLGLWLLPVLLIPLMCALTLKLLLSVSRWQRLVRVWSQPQLWFMSVWWIASLGSFLGFTLVFPLMTAVLFRPPDAALYSSGYPGVFLYAWMLPLAALLMRPLGRWAAMRGGGVCVSQVCFVALALAALAAARFISLALGADYPARYFAGYLLSFSLLFIASGVAHGALVQSLNRVFPPCLRGDASAWLMAIATVGMTYVPLLIAYFCDAGLALAFVSFSVFYGLCLLLNGLFYWQRPSAKARP